MKKIISIIIALTMLLSTVSVFAAASGNNIVVNMLDVNLLDSIIKVKLDKAEKGEDILLVVTNGGKEDNSPDIKLAVQNFNRLTADEEGKAEYSFKLYYPQNGVHGVYANGKKVAEFTYDTDSMSGAVDNIVGYANSGDVTNLTTYLETQTVLNTLLLDAFEPLKLTNPTGLAMGTVSTAIIKEVKEANINNEFSGDPLKDGAKMQSIIKTVVAIELLNQNRDDKYIFNSDGSLVYDSALALSKIDKDSVTLYDYYLNGYSDGVNEFALTDAGKAAVKAALKGKTFVKAEDVHKAFVEAVILNGINKSSLKTGTGITFGYIKGLLTPENKALVGVKGNITDFIANKLATSAPSTIEELNNLISQYAAQEAQQGAGSGSGGGAGGGFGGGGLGITPSGTMVVTPVVNVDIAKQNDKNASENAKDTFSDMAGAEWALNAIEALADKGIINGVGNGKFDPQGTVTREQFVKMLCVALNLTEEAEISFTDIAADDWSVPYIKKAVKAGLISGIDENTFGYGVGISRQDIAVILHRTLKDTTGDAQFADKAEIADYAVAAVGALSGLKILNGFEDGSFKPGASCTRAQAAVIIYNYLNR